MSEKTKGIASVALAVLASATLPGSVRAADIHVGPGQSIQAAIVSASPGQNVLVAPGTYAEAIDFLGKAIRVVGTGGPDVTVIDATGLGTSTVSMVSGEPAGTELRGFTVTGGVGSLLASGFLVGGGIACDLGAVPSIARCRIVGNSAAGGVGGGLGAVGGAAPTVSECLFRTNSAQNGGGIGAQLSGTVWVERCTFDGNMAAALGGGVYGPPITALDCRFLGNQADLGGGASSTLALTRCLFRNNTATTQGGGLHVQASVTATLDACSFFGNSAGVSGGGAFVNATSDFFGPFLNVRQCAFAGNQAPAGAALVLAGTGTQSAQATLEHCTVAGHTLGGAVRVVAKTLAVRNSILWGNTLPHLDTSFLTGTVSTTYSDVQGTAPGLGNFSLDPQFVDLASDDVHLTAGSPCRDAGDPSSLGPGLDFDGDPRLHDLGVDCGADEFHVRLHADGSFTPGGVATATVLDQPSGAPTLLFIGGLPLHPGIPTDFGTFNLQPPFFQVVLPPLPASGALMLSGTIPAGSPSVAVHLQAFTGTHVTNLETFEVW